MARIVYITNGMASTLNSSLELSRQLVEAGHELTYLSHVDLAESMAAHGFPFEQLRACQRIDEQRKQRLARIQSPRSLTGRLAVAHESRHFRAESLAATEVEERLAELRPELLIIDVEMHYCVLASRRLGIPTVLPIVWFSIFRRPGLPPLHTLLRPGQGLRIAAAWARLLGSRCLRQLLFERSPKRRALRRLPVRYDTTDRRSLRALARAKGVAFDELTDWKHWLKPHVYRGIKVLSFNAWELEFPHDPSDEIAYVGPMVRRERDETKASGAALEQWREFRDLCKSEGRPLVYCSLGTFWSADKLFLSKVLEVFRRRTDWALVLGLGGKLTRDDFEDVPANALPMNYAPQLEVLEAAAMAITHGGITTINECIAASVPMLVCSTGHVDQDGCAARVAYHGLGALAELSSVDGATLEAEISRVLGDQEMRARVQDMQRVFARYADERVALNAIERMLETASSES